MSKPNKAKRDRYNKAHPERGRKTAEIKNKKGITTKFK